MEDQIQEAIESLRWGGLISGGSSASETTTPSALTMASSFPTNSVPLGSTQFIAVLAVWIRRQLAALCRTAQDDLDILKS
jgi:hypothetical protein